MRNLYSLAFGFAFLAVAVAAHAQVPTFTWAVPQPLNLSQSTFNQYPQGQVAADANGGAATLGMHTWVDNYSSYSFGTLQLRHYTASGVEDWAKIFPGNALGFQLRYAPNGNLVVLGRYLDSLRLGPQHYLSASTSSPHSFLATLDATGNPLWVLDMDQEFGPTNYAEGLTTDAQSNVYFAARTGNSVYIRKYSPTGQPLSVINQTPITVSSLDVDDLGNLYVTGSCVNSTGGTFGGVTFVPNVSGNGYNRYLVRYRPNGTPAWVKFSGDGTCPDSEVRVKDAGSVYWAGELGMNVTFDSHALNGPSNGGTPAFHLARVDSSGNYQWVTEVPTSQDGGAGIGKGHYLEVDQNGNALIVGSQKGTVDWAPGLQTASTGSFDPMVVQYSPAGQVNWAKIANNTNVYDYGFSLSISPNGSIYATGITRNTLTLDNLTVTGASATNYPWVARLGGSPVSGAAPALNSPELTLYPNPATQLLTVAGSKGAEQIEVLDVLGRICRQFTPANQPETTVSLAGLPAGAYVLRVLGPNDSQTARFFKAE